MTTTDNPVRKQRNHGAPTLSMVAERVGVSKSTVSHVLHGCSKNIRVSAATASRILEAAEALQYKPNAIARSLRSRSTNIIGFYSGYGLLSTWSSFLTEILRGLNAGCNEYRKDMLVHGTFQDRPAADIYAELINGKIDGLCMLTFPDDPLVALLAESSLPAIMIADPAPNLPSVTIDDAGGARLLVEHLAGQGHRHVLYRTNPVASLVSVVHRLEGFQQAASALGVTVTVSHAADNTHQWTEQERACLELPAAQRPTAIACWYDGLAYETLKLCRNHGLRVPHDMAVTGFDGIPVTPEPADRLTTVRAPWFDAAKTALSLLVSRIEGREIPTETVLPVELVNGDTG